MHRFYCSNLQSGVLDEGESHHALRVLRIKQEETIFVFDGKGKVAEARFSSQKGEQVAFEILSMKETPAPRKLCLAQALPKGKAMELILQKATELGVQEIFPVIAEHSVVRVKEEKKKQEKWQQVVIESCKQCGQNWMPQVFSPLPLKDFLKETQNHDALKLIASLHSQARPLRIVLDNIQQKEIIFLVGPEGDFTSEETGLAIKHDFQSVSLGSNILRCETAAIFLASVLTYEANT